jgi:hypothetical protein
MTDDEAEDAGLGDLAREIGRQAACRLDLRRAGGDGRDQIARGGEDAIGAHLNSLGFGRPG